MNGVKWGAVIGIFILFLSSLSCSNKGPQVLITTPEGEKKIVVELAQTAQEKARGLMFRHELKKDHGMLFINQRDERASFWMKNTYLSLDIIFISHDGRIADIFACVPPCPMEPCPSYRSSEPIRYTLEVPAGFASAHQIKKGGQVELLNIPEA